MVDAIDESNVISNNCAAGYGRAITLPSTDQNWAEVLGANSVGHRAFARYLPPVKSPSDPQMPTNAKPTSTGGSSTLSVGSAASTTSKPAFESRRNRTTGEFDTLASVTLNFSQQGTGPKNNTRSGDALAAELLGVASSFQLVTTVSETQAEYLPRPRQRECGIRRHHRQICLHSIPALTAATRFPVPVANSRAPASSHCGSTGGHSS